MNRLVGSPVLWIGLCVAALLFRVTLGVDLGDESYYAAFVDGWLKRGLGNNPNLMVHQTADLVVYPFAWTYHALRGDADGLVLLLRCIYIGIATLSATCLYRALVATLDRPGALLSAVFVLAFVPFSLPAPSYNTIGMYALIGALSVFALALNDVPGVNSKSSTARSSALMPWLSAAWWAASCVAYPPMLSAMLMLMVVTWRVFHADAERRFLMRYAMACALLLALSLAVLSMIFSPAHLVEMVRFTNAFNNVSGGFASKVKAALTVLEAHPYFAGLLVGAFAISGLRCVLPARWARAPSVLLAALVIGVAASKQPAFFSRSHDLIIVLAITGVCLGVRQLLSPMSDRPQRLRATLYAVSLVAGFTTAATAFNGLFNFPVGACLAACLSMTLGPPSAGLIDKTARARVPVWSALGLAGAALAATTFTSFYGQIGGLNLRTSVRIESGAFAGLLTDQDQASFIAQMTSGIAEHARCGTRIAVLGTGPGFYLMTPLMPSTLSTWNLDGNVRNLAAQEFEKFYADSGNQPDVVVVNRWRWATALSDADRALLAHYASVKRVAVGFRDASIYRRADCATSDGGTTKK